jgi:hypothetical protein
MAASMAAFLLAAGQKGKRYTLPNSRIMIHQPLGGVQGQAADIEIHAKEILYLRERLNKLLAERTGQPVEKIAKDTDRDNCRKLRTRRQDFCQTRRTAVIFTRRGSPAPYVGQEGFEREAPLLLLLRQEPA